MNFPFISKLLYACGLAAIVAMISSCEQEAPVDKYTEEKILVIGNSTEPQSIDPQVVTSVVEGNIVRALFEGLCVQHPSQEGIHLPGAASHWEANDAFTEWTFHLQPEGKWSDGTPLTTEDFLFAYERILTPALGSEYASILYYIEGAEAFNKGKTTNFDTVAVKALDSHTLVLKLRSPTPFLPDLTKHPTWYPVPKHTILKHGTMAQVPNLWTEVENIVSNGPFKLTSWQFNQQISVTKNNHYWDTKTVQLNGIRFLPISNEYTEARMFFNDQLHITYTLAPEMIDYSRKKSPESSKQDTYLGTSFLRFNVTNEHLKNVKLRQALAFAVDSQAIIDNILKGGQKAAYSITPPMGAYEPPKVSFFDPEKARQLLNEAGYSEGTKLSLTLLTADKGKNKTLAEAYQDMWKKHLGIDVSIKQTETKTYYDKMSNLDYDIVTSGWIGDYPDPTTFLDMWRKGDGNNRTGWYNDEYETILKEAAQTQDPKARFHKLENAEALFLSEMPIVPICWSTQSYLLHTSVKGWHPLLLNNHPYKFVDLIADQSE